MHHRILSERTRHLSYFAIALLISSLGFVIAPAAGGVFAREIGPSHQLALAAGSTQPSDQVGPASVTVTYAMGWNLIGGPTGTMITGAFGPLYTFKAGDAAYEVVSPGTPLTAGAGYWAYFMAPTMITLSGSGSSTASAQLPADQFVMIGNPSTAALTVSGADIVDTFNTATNSYTSTTGTATLQPGQGAWALSFRGATVSIGGTPVTPTPVATATPVPTATPAPMAARVSIINLSFNPASISVTRGSTVTWMNSDSVTHTVTSDSGSFDLGFVVPGMSVSMTFSTPGTYNYHCNIHPFMHGTVTVQ